MSADNVRLACLWLAYLTSKPLSPTRRNVSRFRPFETAHMSSCCFTTKRTVILALRCHLRLWTSTPTELKMWRIIIRDWIKSGNSYKEITRTLKIIFKRRKMDGENYYTWLANGADLDQKSLEMLHQSNPNVVSNIEYEMTENQIGQLVQTVDNFHVDSNR